MEDVEPVGGDIGGKLIAFSFAVDTAAAECLNAFLSAEGDSVDVVACLDGDGLLAGGEVRIDLLGSTFHLDGADLSSPFYEGGGHDVEAYFYRFLVESGNIDEDVLGVDRDGG